MVKVAGLRQFADRVPLRRHGGQLRRRAGERAARRGQPLPGGAHRGPRRRELPDGAAGEGRLDGRLAEADPERRDIVDPVPGAQRRPARLMGSNMQRQAVPLVRPETPIVMTGVEAQAAQDSGQVILAEDDGEVLAADARLIRVRYDNGDEREYPLLKFVRSNQGTCINQRPTVERASACARAQRWPTAHRPAKASSRSARACSSPSCRGRATTSRMRSSSRRPWCAKISSRLSTSRSTRWSRATPSSGRRRSRATSRTSARSRCATSTRTASSVSAPK